MIQGLLESIDIPLVLLQFRCLGLFHYLSVSFDTFQWLSLFKRLYEHSLFNQKERKLFIASQRETNKYLNEKFKVKLFKVKYKHKAYYQQNAME